MVSPTVKPRRVIWFCSTEGVARQPESLARLRDEIGLTTIMPESSVCHTSGFRATPAAAARGPFQDWRERVDLWPQAAQGIYPPVAGVIGGFDDGDLLRVIEAARAAGIEAWGHIGLWSYGGDVFPELAMRDVDGAALDARWKRWGIGLCPSRTEVNAWTADGLADAAARYDLDGFCVDHARYPMAANVHALAACGCERCLAEGARLGFDARGLIGVVRAARAALQRLDAARAARALASGRAGAALLPELGVDAAIGDWFRMRAALLAARMSEFRDRVRSAKARLLFGSDVFSPSVALLGGHDQARWEAATDFLTGGSSAGGVVGWATGATNAAAEWARALRAAAPSVGEAAAVELALRLLEVGDVEGLPRSADALEAGPIPVEVLYEREVARLAAGTTGAVPLYPPVSAAGDPARVRRLCAAIAAHGCHGAMITVDPGDAAMLRALREGLPA